MNSNGSRIREDLKVGSGDRRSKAQPDHNTKANQHGCGDERADCAEIVDPLANAQAKNVENRENC